jgi:hypothetical protein
MSGGLAISSLVASFVACVAGRAAPGLEASIPQRKCDAPEVLTLSSVTVFRTMAFGGNSRRIQVAVDGATSIYRIVKDQWASSDQGTRPTSEEDLLVGVRPQPMPAQTAGCKPAVNEDLASLQRTYRKLVQLGLFEEAAEIADLIVRPGNRAGDPNVIPVAAVAEVPTNGVQRASLTDVAKVPWTSVSLTLISCRFTAVPLEDVARFFQSETGCVVKVETDLRPMPVVHFTCRNIPAGDALAQVVESCGWTMERRRDGVTLRPAMLLPLRADRLPVLR